MTRPIALALLLLSASAVPALPAAGKSAPQAAARPAPPMPARAKRGLAFAQKRCSGCHAVVPNTISPNPESPPFEDIANMPGLTAATFRQFLSDSHNYPAAMNFTVDRARIGDLAAYMVTLKRPGHRPQQ